MGKLYVKEREPCERFYRTHVTFTSVGDVTAITESLKKIGITYFTFDRTYTDGSHIRLTNAGAWIESYYREKLYDVAIFEKDPRMFTDGYVFWSWLSREPIYSASALHNIDHGLTITQPHEKYCDFFHFGTTRDNPIPPTVLIEKLPILYRFIAVFKEQAHKLILSAENTRFILPVKNISHIRLQDINLNNDPIDIFNRSEITRLYLGDEFNNNYLTKREIEILGLLKEGQKPVDIARDLILSDRTLETHIKNIKEKFNCNTLFELGYVTCKLGIHNIYPFGLPSRDATNKKLIQQGKS